MEFPRYVHGPRGEHRLVETPHACELALAEGYALTPFLTPEQRDAVRAAQLKAGEIAPAPEPPPVPEPPKTTRGRR